MAETSVLHQAGAEIISLRADNDRLRAELAEAKARIAELEAAGNRLGDAAIAGILDGRDRAERAEAERDAMREALEPFAGLRATRFMTDGLRYEFRVDAAWIRKARAALNPPD